MAQREPMTKTMKASETRDQWSHVINQVFRRETRVIVEKSGIPVAAIVSAADFERLTQLEARRQRDFSILDEIGEAFKDVPEEELEGEVNRAILAARKQRHP